MKPSSLCSLLSFICCTAILHQCIAVPPSFDLVGPFPLVSGNSSLQLVALVSGVRSSADVDYLEWCTFAFELFANGRMNEPVLRTGSNVCCVIMQFLLLPHHIRHIVFTINTVAMQHPVAVEGDGSVLLRRTIDGLEAGAQYRSRVTSSCEGGRYTQTTPASDFIIMPSCGNGVVEPGEECDAGM
jgi:hypothetical protein